MSQVMGPANRELPRKLNLGSGKSWQADSLNIDVNPLWRPDVCIDMSLPDLFSHPLDSERFGRFYLPPDYFDEIVAVDVLEHVPDLVTLMTNCLKLLRNGGVLNALVPFDLSYGAWQDPTHVRAFNERSWLYYTDWFWYLGWRDARFDLTELKFLLSDVGQKLAKEGVSHEMIARAPRAVDSIHVTLSKRPLSDAERAEFDRRTRRA
jgi:SAM-dependent methyltransferase